MGIRDAEWSEDTNTIEWVTTKAATAFRLRTRAKKEK